MRFKIFAFWCFCLAIIVGPQFAFAGRYYCAAVDENGHSWPETLADTTAAIACKPSHYGNLSRKCKQDGTWSPHVNFGCRRCQRTTFENVHFPESDVDTMVEGKCAACYVGKPQMYCFANATWSYVIENPCEVLKCPSVFERGVQWLETLCTETVTIPCNNHTYGTLSRTCKRNKWGHITGICQRCKGGFFEHTRFWNSNVGKYNYGKCVEGFDGHPRRYCLSNATWKDEIERPCQKIPCPEKKEFGAHWEATTTWGVIQGKCLGKKSGLITRECHKGVWSTTVKGACA